MKASTKNAEPQVKAAHTVTRPQTLRVLGAELARRMIRGYGMPEEFAALVLAKTNDSGEAAFLAMTVASFLPDSLEREFRAAFPRAAIAKVEGRS